MKRVCVGGLCGVSDDFPEAVCVENGVYGGKVTAGDALCCLHRSSVRLGVCGRAAAVPGGDKASLGMCRKQRCSVQISSVF